MTRLIFSVSLVAPFVAGHEPLPPVCTTPTVGSEGKTGAGRDLLADYDIAQVQVLMRHGARSYYHIVPNVTNPRYFSCELQGTEREIVADWPRYFEILDAKDGVPLKPQPDLDLETVPTPVGPSCIYGPTASKSGFRPEGVRQLADLGARVRDAYGSFLASLWPEEVYIRARNMPRCLQSATSFLAGILGGTNATAGGRGKFQLNVHNKLANEPIEGLPCPRGKHLLTVQDQSFVYPADVVAELSRLFDVSDFEPYVYGSNRVDPAIADITMTSLCDGGELPCGPGGCIDEALQRRLASIYDEKWYDQYEGHLGGQEASQVFFYPLLAEVLDRMTAAPSARVKLGVLAGGDRIIGPVAAALGIFNGRWPPFGAHIVFELWEQKATGDMMVRVLFDGDDVTSRVTGCGGAALCPLATFSSAVPGLLAPYASHEEACVMDGDQAGAAIETPSLAEGASSHAVVACLACLALIVAFVVTTRRKAPRQQAGQEQPLLQA